MTLFLLNTQIHDSMSNVNIRVCRADRFWINGIHVGYSFMVALCRYVLKVCWTVLPGLSHKYIDKV